MLQRLDSPQPECLAALQAASEADPELAAWAAALGECRHPKAQRLLLRLAEYAQHPGSAEQRAQLRADIHQLLTLSFGKAEAQRRLQ
ncbi:MAG: hypothetical protein HZY78_12580 [Burkholderiaceae bacterium]|jgi:hypothetical protein|nr:MAG: hypothetical protein HZY78_12580 [Burkholderiaceae bacterium]